MLELEFLFGIEFNLHIEPDEYCKRTVDLQVFAVQNAATISGWSCPRGVGQMVVGSPCPLGTERLGFQLGGTTDSDDETACRLRKTEYGSGDG
jgi:hypothetical protein